MILINSNRIFPIQCLAGNLTKIIKGDIVVENGFILQSKNDKNK